MSTKVELHNLVDQLREQDAVEVLAYLRQLHANGGAIGEAVTSGSGNAGATAVPGRAFFAQPRSNLATLAAEQGVRPVADFDELLGDFWPEDETPDEFAAAVRQWRREGGHA
jgi:hypothetical protein